LTNKKLTSTIGSAQGDHRAKIEKVKFPTNPGATNLTGNIPLGIKSGSKKSTSKKSLIEAGQSKNNYERAYNRYGQKNVKSYENSAKRRLPPSQIVPQQLNINHNLRNSSQNEITRKNNNMRSERQEIPQYIDVYNTLKNCLNDSKHNTSD
jgi:hypothetical protein